MVIAALAGSMAIAAPITPPVTGTFTCSGSHFGSSSFIFSGGIFGAIYTDAGCTATFPANGNRIMSSATWVGVYGGTGIMNGELLNGDVGGIWRLYGEFDLNPLTGVTGYLSVTRVLTVFPVYTFKPGFGMAVIGNYWQTTTVDPRFGDTTTTVQLNLVDANDTPEPGTVLMTAGGLIAVAILRRRATAPPRAADRR